MVYVVGYQPVAGIPINDYFDFAIGSKFQDEEVKKMAEIGVMPPGLILQMLGGWPCVIKGDYETPQTAERLSVQHGG